jgi:hypothetical protein
MLQKFILENYSPQLVYNVHIFPYYITSYTLCPFALYYVPNRFMPISKSPAFFVWAGHKGNPPPHFMSRTPRKIFENLSKIKTLWTCQLSCKHKWWKFNVKMSSKDLKLWPLISIGQNVTNVPLILKIWEIIFLFLGKFLYGLFLRIIWGVQDFFDP